MSVRSNLLAFFDRAPIALPLNVPSSIDQAAKLSQFITEFTRLGLSPGEVALFFRKILEFVVASDQKREEALESKTWWEFLECAKPGKSRAYQDLVRATTRTSVAAKAEEVSAYTIGRLALRTLLDTMSTVDRVLNGPTNEVWIEPWVIYLKGRGVKFHPNMELQSLVFDGDSRDLRHLRMEPVFVSRVRKLRKRIAESLSARDFETQDFREAAKQVEQSVRVLKRDIDEPLAKRLELDQLLDSCTRYDARQSYEDVCRRFDSMAAAIEMEPEEKVVAAQYFVLALPLEQLAFYVNRTTMLSFLAPELRSVIRLQREMDWMAGIQFYFACPLDITTGHIVGVDSDWALTAVEQTQFWDDIKLPPNIKAVLSVDIAAWNRKGRKIRKDAFHCTPEEIAEEVWAQLTEMMNRSKRLPVLDKSMLVDGELKRNVSFHLDDSIVERDDRKKQAFYERARSLSFSLTGDLSEEADPGDKVEEGFMWGERSVFNTEPLLINRVGTRKLRPEATTSVPNLFLAGDYVRTETDLACMEGANEAARLAVNGILERCASREPLCEVWPFSPSRQAMEGMLGLFAPTQAVRNVANLVSRLPGKFWKNFGGGE